MGIISAFSKLIGSSGNTGPIGIGANVITGLAGDILWKISGKPDVLLGIIPIYTAQRYEVARSHDKMKYRAVAGQFFAHQRGGNVGFKCVMLLVGPHALDYLTFIQILHIMGQAGNNPIKNASEKLKGAVGGFVAKNTANFGVKDTSWRNKETHWTFPIITREEIMHDMYIETVVYERDIQLGDAIKLTIMCRQYHAPPEIQSIELIDSTGLTITTNAAKQLNDGVFNESVKDIRVSYKSTNAELTNALAIVENIAHRAYINNLADPMSDLNKVRSVAGRLGGGSVYEMIGKSPGRKIWKTVTDNFTSLKSDFLNLVSPGIDKLMNVADNSSYDQAKSQQLRNTSKTFIMASNNAVLHAKEFAALDGSGETIYLTNPQSAVLLDTIEPGDGRNVFFQDGPVRDHLTIEVKENGILHASNIKNGGLGNLPLTYSTSTKCFLPSKTFRVVIYPVRGIYNKKTILSYEIYRYDGEVSGY